LGWFLFLALTLVLFTLSVGQPIILYIASLENILVSYLEAANIDGASRWIIAGKA
jgi:multiple sugar transport system permease protein